DPQVALVLAGAEFGQVAPVVQDGPEDPVGEAVVVLVELARVQVGEDVADAIDLGGGRLGRVVGHAAAPAEPYAFAFLHRGGHRDGEPPWRLLPVLVGRGDPVGDYDQASHKPSSHEIDSRIAELTMPAME